MDTQTSAVNGTIFLLHLMSKLSEIEPKHQQRLIDLVKEACVDVSDWANFKGRKEAAASNPKYCYEWAFLEPKKFVVLNLWYENMEQRRDGSIFIQFNNRKFASQRKGIEKNRAFRTDQKIQMAVKDAVPIRVIVLGGRRRDNLTEKASKVSKRLLDRESWSFTTYDWNTGECTITRGIEKFVDQFSIQPASQQETERREISGMSFVRSPVVRSKVLLRAKGKCELCGELGFLMTDDRIYLETHHVIPLSENGPDTESNVAALCPNHHREAHHGKNKAAMREKLLKRFNR